MNLPLDYISKDIISKEDFGCTFKRAKDTQNQGFGLLIYLQILGNIYRQGNPCTVRYGTCCHFFSSMSRPSISWQNTKLNVTTNETLDWLLEEAKLLFPIHCHSLLPSTPGQDLLHPTVGSVIHHHAEETQATMASQQVLYWLP